VCGQTEQLICGLVLCLPTKNNRIKYNAHEPRNVVEQFGGFYGFPVLSEGLVSGRTRIGSDFLDQFKGNEVLPNEWVYYDPSAYFAEIWPTMGEGYSQIPTEWSPNSYEIQEETLATYIQANLESEFLSRPLRVEGGVRLESTTTTSRGFEQTLVSLRFTDPTSMAPVYADGGAQEYSEEASYDVLLPNISLKWDVSDDVVARFAAGRTIARPNINDLRSVRSIGDTRPQGAMTATSGNPNLKPYSADNLDLGVEWYYSELSYVSASYFWKSINDFIVGGTAKETINGVRDPSTNGGTIDDPTPDAEADLAVFDVSRPVNGPTARVEGFELAVQHTFGDTGFGVGANATFVTTNRDLVKEDVDNRFAVVGVSDSVNLVGFYEQGPFQARLAYNWRDSFLNCFCQLQGGDAVVVEDYGQWDLTLGYDLTDDITLQFEGTNITGEGYRSTGRYAEQMYEAISTGPRVALGIRMSF
jgi:iron complex outermembrane receptor protein